MAMKRHDQRLLRLAIALTPVVMTVAVASAALYHGQVTPVVAAHTAGACSGSDVLNTALMYSPTKDTWWQVAPMHSPREWATPIYFTSKSSPLYGHILIAGGLCAHHKRTPQVLATSEIYNPWSNTWVQAGNLHYAREAYVSSILPGGKVLVAGGIAPDGSILHHSELFDPATRQWSVVGNMIYAVHDAQAVTLTSGPFAGQIMVAGGYSSAGVRLADVQAYDPATARWHLLPSMIANADGTVGPQRVMALTASLKNGTVIVARGDDKLSMVAYDELYDPIKGGLGAWRLQNAVDANNLPISPRESFASTVLSDTDGTLLVAGGFSQDLCSATTYDATTHVWTTTAPMLICGLMSGTLTPLNDGTALMIGGYSTYSHAPNIQPSTVIANVTQYSPVTNSWQAVSPMPSPRRGAMAVTLMNGRVLVVGGDTGGV